MMKHIMVLLVGVALGVGATMYHYDQPFRSQVKSHTAATIGSVANSAQQALK
jgi:hypothetical protein